MEVKISTKIKRTNIAMLRCFYTEEKIIHAILTKRRIFWMWSDVLNFFEIPEEHEMAKGIEKELENSTRKIEITYNRGNLPIPFTEIFVNTEVLLILARFRSPTFLQSNFRAILSFWADELIKEAIRRNAPGYCYETDIDPYIYQNIDEEDFTFNRGDENEDLLLIRAVQKLQTEEDVTKFFEDFVRCSDPRTSSKTNMNTNQILRKED